jgi:predicted RNA-binding Zn-ribbon protein involved in translation (DUF1610 family)
VLVHGDLFVVKKGRSIMQSVTVTCPHCGEEVEIDEDVVEQDDVIVCDGCGEQSVYWNGALVTADDAHEYRCDSLASRDYEERAYGSESRDTCDLREVLHVRI